MGENVFPMHLYISQDMHVAETEADWLGDAEKENKHPKTNDTNGWKPLLSAWGEMRLESRAD